MSNVLNKVLKKLNQIPKGKITTYKELAKAVGRPRAIRFVASILAKNPWPDKYPCYKVVRSDGKIGGYKLGVGKKKDLLKKEGIRFKKGKIVGLENHLYKFKNC